MNTPRPSAHRNAVIPGSMLGGRKCIAGIVISWGNLPVSPDPFHWSAPRTGDFVAGPKKFAEPVSRSSTASADLPLPGTAFGLGFDLLALRARRKRHRTKCVVRDQVIGKGRGRNLRKVQFSTFP